MKKIFYLVPVLGLLYSCSGESKQTDQSAEELHQQIEIMEASTENLDESITTSDAEMEKSQAKIDSLLNNI